MATSVRFRVGLGEVQLEADTRSNVGRGRLLSPHEAARVLAGVRDPGTLAEIRSLAIGVGARSFEWDDELPLRVAALLELGRLRLRVIEAVGLRVLSSEEQTDDEPEQREENEIAETHSVMIELVDAEGNPVPGEPFRIKLPDGTIRSLTLDDEGKAHVTGIEQPGTCEVCFYKRDAAIWAPA